MKTNTLTYRVLKLLIFSCMLFSCNKESQKKDTYLIKVDSIHAPAAATSNEPFTIEFFGTIAGNGCYFFDGFSHSLNGNDINIEAWGNYEDYAGVCPTVIVYLTGHNLTLTLPSPGVYNIKIKQPDNSFLSRQITAN